jgi:hypothetical protein
MGVSAPYEPGRAGENLHRRASGRLGGCRSHHRGWAMGLVVERGVDAVAESENGVLVLGVGVHGLPLG